MSCKVTEAVQANVFRRLAGDLGADEARELDRHLADCESCRAAAAAATALWGDFGALPEEKPSAALRPRFESMLAAEVAAEERRSRPLEFRRTERSVVQPVPPLRRWLPLAAVLAFGFGLGWLFWGRGSSDVVALREEVGELHQLVAQSLLEKSSVSERLQGVAYGREFSSGEPGVAAALVHALQNDSNVNVRLAALEALRPIATRDSLRPQLIAAATSGDSPLVSLSVIDVLLEAGSPEARRDLEQLMNDPNLEPVVRGYLRDRLGRRI